MKFSELGLAPEVLRAIEEAGYEEPTPIQAGAIPPALEGRDVLGIAQTGTGKTASFVLPMVTILSKGRARARMPRSLVLCPTRELAAQVAENFDIYAKYTKLTKALLIGGVSFKDQDRLIDRGVDVLIATPGRLLDHFERGKLLLTGVQIMVVDEADRMLDMGFIPDIERIFKLTPFTRQTLFFSATMPSEIERLTQTFLSNPARVEVARQSTTSETIEQGLVFLRPSRRDRAAKEKRELLRALIAAEGEACTNAIVFCNRKVDVDIVAKSLRKHGLNAAAIHGDLDQTTRMKVLDGFREGEIRFLVASDVAARGLDIPSVSHVFNFDVPTHPEDYVHRIGRTGRAGRTGKALTIATPADEKLVAAIERLIGREIPRIENPLGGATSPAPAEAEGEEAAKAPADTAAKGGRKRSRRGRGGSKSRETSREADRTGTAPQSAAPAEKAAEPPAAREKADATADEQPVESAAADEKPSRARRTRSRGGSRKTEGQRDGQRRGSDQKAPVVGMGDHMPAFLSRSFERPKRGK